MAGEEELELEAEAEELVVPRIRKITRKAAERYINRENDENQLS